MVPAEWCQLSSDSSVVTAECCRLLLVPLQLRGSGPGTRRCPGHPKGTAWGGTAGGPSLLGDRVLVATLASILPALRLKGIIIILKPLFLDIYCGELGGVAAAQGQAGAGRSELQKN